MVFPLKEAFKSHLARRTEHANPEINMQIQCQIDCQEPKQLIYIEKILNIRRKNSTCGRKKSWNRVDADQICLSLVTARLTHGNSALDISQRRLKAALIFNGYDRCPAWRSELRKVSQY